MRGLQLFLFVVLLPAIAALGHDIYLYTQNQEMGFKLAALGWILTKYAPDAYKQLVEATEPAGYWPWINWVLAQKAVFVGLAFAGVFWVLAGILKLLGVVGEPAEIRNFTGNRKLDEMLGKAKGGKFKYNRK